MESEREIPMGSVKSNGGIGNGLLAELKLRLILTDDGGADVVGL